MPITKITLENVKGISDRTEVANLEPGFKFPVTPCNRRLNLRSIDAKTHAQKFRLTHRV